MKIRKQSFAINSYHQAMQTISICYNKNILPIIYIKYFIVNGLGPHWLEELNNLLEQQFAKKNFNLFVDCKKNYGLFINLVEKKIDYLKVDAKKDQESKTNQRAQLLLRLGIR